MTIDHRLHFNLEKHDTQENRWLRVQTLLLQKQMLLTFEEICQYLIIKKGLLAYKVCHTPCDSFTYGVFCTFKGLLCFEDLLYCMFDTIKKNMTRKQKHTGMSYICDLHLEEVLQVFKLPSSWPPGNRRSLLQSQQVSYSRAAIFQVCQELSWIAPAVLACVFIVLTPILKQTNKQTKLLWMKNCIITLIKKNSCNFG